MPNNRCCSTCMQHLICADMSKMWNKVKVHTWLITKTTLLLILSFLSYLDRNFLKRFNFTSERMWAKKGTFLKERLNTVFSSAFIISVEGSIQSLCTSTRWFKPTLKLLWVKKPWNPNSFQECASAFFTSAPITVYHLAVWLVLYVIHYRDDIRATSHLTVSTLLLEVMSLHCQGWARPYRSQRWCNSTLVFLFSNLWWIVGFIQTLM